MWDEFVVGSLLYSERFFSGFSGFPLSLKTNISKSRFDPRMHGHFWTSSCEFLGALRVNKLHFHFFYNYIFYIYLLHETRLKSWKRRTAKNYSRSIIMLLTWNQLHFSWSYWLPKILLLLYTCDGIKDAVLHLNGLVASCHCKWQTVWHENINSIDSSALNSFLEIQSLIANFHTIYYKSCLQNLA